MQAAVHIEAERRRVESVVETLTSCARRSDSSAALSHDARNMVTALSLYCDLLDQPGVLADGYQHCAQELRLVTDASSRLLEKLVSLERNHISGPVEAPLDFAAFPCPAESCISNFAEELEANRNLLDAIAGLGVAVTMRISGGAVAVAMHGEDLTRILVNLVKNAAEAMHGTGTISIELRQQSSDKVVVTVQDSGPGIPASLREKVFEGGYSTHALATGGWAGPHRGLGLAICRSLVEAAAGRIRVTSPKAGGARFLIELPTRA